MDSDDAPLEFSIPRTGEEYLDLAHTRLRVQCKILTSKDEPLTAADHFVAPVNNFLHAMFTNCQIELNQKCISSPSGLYNYRAMIENLLNYGAEAKQTHLTTSLFYKDTAGSMSAEEGNEGYVKRRAFAQQGVFDMEGHVHSDIFNQSKYMLNGVNIVLKFYKARPEFALITKDDDNNKYKIKITEAVLIVRKIKMSPAILIAHANTMLKFSARYPITRVEIKNITIPKDLQNYSLDNVFLGQLPQRIVVLFVDAVSFNGTLKTNPFNFQHFNHTYLTTATDAALHVTPLKPNYTSKLFISSYNTLFTATGVNFADTGSNITREEYANGYNITVFDLTPDISAHEPHLSAQSSGSLRIEVQFEKNLTKAITALVFAEFSNIIEIDRFRQVSIDYAA